jgi:hypothetical protein
MIRYSCDLTGDTQVLGTFGAGNRVDECCDQEASGPSFAAAEECCSETMVTLPETSPAPAQLTDQMTAVLVALDVPAPDTSVRMAIVRESLPDRALFSRNLPLLV